MAQKKITDLTLRSDFDATCNLPADDTSQTWRVTGAQIETFIRDGFTKRTVQRFGAGSGTYTPAADVLYIKVTARGPGGGGSGSGSAGASDGVDGSADTTFGANLTAAKGLKGTFSGAGGAGGAPTLTVSGSIILVDKVHGGSGTSGSYQTGSTSLLLAGGAGGSSSVGGAGGGGYAGVGFDAAVNSGSGGGGAGGAATAGVLSGSAGGAGATVVGLYLTPAATAYVVGAGGAGGSAGTSGFAGGAGADGELIVEEFYQ
jgi:hypothetical protein